jgi:hypothetical protein
LGLRGSRRFLNIQSLAPMSALHSWTELVRAVQVADLRRHKTFGRSHAHGKFPSTLSSTEGNVASDQRYRLLLACC